MGPEERTKHIVPIEIYDTCIQRNPKLNFCNYYFLRGNWMLTSLIFPDHIYQIKLVQTCIVSSEISSLLQVYNLAFTG